MPLATIRGIRYKSRLWPDKCILKVSNECIHNIRIKLIQIIRQGTNDVILHLCAGCRILQLRQLKTSLNHSYFQLAGVD